jgi:RNA polymerase sigma-70 factor (ECF subfamily)
MGAIALTREEEWDGRQEELDAFHVRAAQQDLRAFAPLYEAYFNPVYGYCWRLLRDRQAAADAASETFTKALAALSRYKAKSFRGWLFTIAHHVVIDMMRRRKPTTELEAAVEIVDRELSPEEWALAGEGDVRVVQLLKHLPETQRQIVELRMAGLQGQEIAEVLGTSVGAVRTAQYRAYERLRQLLTASRSSSDQGGPNGDL